MSKLVVPIIFFFMFSLFVPAHTGARTRTIYILKTDTSENLLVMRVHKGNWKQMGKNRIVASKVHSPSLHCSEKGELVVGYIRYPYVEVKKYLNGEWSAFCPLEATHKTGAFACAVDKGGNPLVAFEDKAESNRLSVLKYEKKQWNHLGKRGFSDETIATYLAMAVGEDGFPYVAYCGAKNRASQSGAPRLEFRAGAMAWHGSSWGKIGNSALFKGAVTVIHDIKVDPEGIPFVAFAPLGKGSHSSVMRLNDRRENGKTDRGDWQRVGSEEFWEERSNPRIELDKSENLYIAYRNPSRRQGVVRVKGNQFQELQGLERFNKADVIKSDLALSREGTPYLAFTEVLKSGVTTISIVRYVGDSWQLFSAYDFKGYLSDISMTIDQDGIPCVALVLVR